MAGYSSESEAIKLLRAQFDVVNSQNYRLNEENTLLRHKLNRLTNEQRSTTTISVENRLRAFSLEDERDKMFENLERLKLKYNKLHSAYLEKAKRCKTLEELFRHQKILPGLVKKSTLEQMKLGHQEKDKEEEKTSAKQIATLQQSLEEAFDIIDELEFELESVDYLEIENERLRNELRALKKDVAARGDDHRHSNRSSTRSSSCDECGSDGLPDVESIERSVLTNSLIDTVQTDSHLLRRELLRSRLQNSKPNRASVCPTARMPEDQQAKEDSPPE